MAMENYYYCSDYDTDTDTDDGENYYYDTNENSDDNDDCYFEVGEEGGVDDGESDDYQEEGDNQQQLLPAWIDGGLKEDSFKWFLKETDWIYFPPGLSSLIIIRNNEQSTSSLPGINYLTLDEYGYTEKIENDMDRLNVTIDVNQKSKGCFTLTNIIKFNPVLLYQINGGEIDFYSDQITTMPALCIDHTLPYSVKNGEMMISLPILGNGCVVLAMSLQHQRDFSPSDILNFTNSEEKTTGRVRIKMPVVFLNEKINVTEYLKKYTRNTNEGIYEYERPQVVTEFYQECSFKLLDDVRPIDRRFFVAEEPPIEITVNRPFNFFVVNADKRVLIMGKFMGSSYARLSTC